MTSPWVQELVERLGAWVPPELARFVIAAGFVVIGYVLALAVQFLVTRLFRRISRRFASLYRKAARKAGLGPREGDQVESAAIAISGRVAFWLIFALFLGVATTVLGFPVLSAWLESLAGYLPRVLAAAAIVLLGVVSGAFVRAVVTTTAGSSGFAFARSAGRAAQLAVVGLAATIAVDQLGIEITFLVVVASIVLGCTLGAVGLAFGLGARVSVGNLLACHYLAKWYRVGQIVRIGEHEGRIVEILPVAVVLQTGAGRVYIPARTFADQPSLLVGEEGTE